MREVHLRLRVSDDGSIETVPDGYLPPGEHKAIVVVGEPSTQGKPFSMKDFPIHHGEWDHSESLRREDIYGDDGR